MNLSTAIEDVSEDADNHHDGHDYQRDGLGWQHQKACPMKGSMRPQ